MSTEARRAGARPNEAAGDRHNGRPDGGATHKPGRSLAQWFCLIAGLGLLLAGIGGMLTADNNFDSTLTDPNGVLQGDGFLGFEVNGWHNLVHIVSGAVLLFGFFKHGLARTLAIAFGVVYAILLVLGLVNGNDILGFVPVNIADNVLHGVLALLGLGAGLLSSKNKAREPEPHRQSSSREVNVERDRQVEHSRPSTPDRGTPREVVTPADGDRIQDAVRKPRSRG